MLTPVLPCLKLLTPGKASLAQQPKIKAEPEMYGDSAATRGTKRRLGSIPLSISIAYDDESSRPIRRRRLNKRIIDLTDD